MCSFTNHPRYLLFICEESNFCRETVQGETNVKAIIQILLVWGWYLVLTYQTAKSFSGMSLEGEAAFTVL